MRVTLAILALAASFSISQSGTHPDGVSKVSREQDALGNYKFSYAVTNSEGEHFREEGTDQEGRVVGRYGLTHRDGTSRVVDYVADKDGFRAEVRSNEPGLASSEVGDAQLFKLQPDAPLAVAATDVDSSQSAFGARLKTTDTSRVSYADDDEEPLKNPTREARQRNFGDYRPRNPVAYYPAVDIARPSRAPAYSPRETQRRPRTRVMEPSQPSERDSDQTREKLRSPDPAVESRPLDVYLPPINPNTAIRRPYIDSSENLPNRFTSTSQRPFFPPYGGFDDDPHPFGRRPGVSMSTIHGGVGADDFDSPQTSTPSYGAGRYPSDDFSLSRDFIRPQFPPVVSRPRARRPLGRPNSGDISPVGPLFPREVGRGPSGFFSPPNLRPGRAPPKLVLRAVPIPNGIQAVHVDPETGRVHERVLYPLYLTQDGHPEYDRNVLLHYDVNDDDAFQNDNPGFDDFPFRRRIPGGPFRSARNLDFDKEFRNRSRSFNDSLVDLGIPTARDFSWIQKQLSLIEDFDQSRYSNSPVLRNEDNGERPLFNDFDDESLDRENSPYDRNLNRRDFSQNPRNFDRLQPEDTKAILVSESENDESDAKAEETPNSSS